MQFRQAQAGAGRLSRTEGPPDPADRRRRLHEPERQRRGVRGLCPAARLRHFPHRAVARPNDTWRYGKQGNLRRGDRAGGDIRRDHRLPILFPQPALFGAMTRLLPCLRDKRASAAAEMALVMPFLLALMVGAVELGNLFVDQHALEKQVRNGARYASRLEIDENYACPTSVFADADATAKVINVTKNGVVDGTGNPRWTGYWSRACPGKDALTVGIRCVAKSQIDVGDTGN